MTLIADGEASGERTKDARLCSPKFHSITARWHLWHRINALPRSADAWRGCEPNIAMSRSGKSSVGGCGGGASSGVGWVEEEDEEGEAREKVNGGRGQVCRGLRTRGIEVVADVRRQVWKGTGR